MRLYIAGPISGLAQDNYPAFLAASEILSKEGHECRTPFYGMNICWNHHHGRDYVSGTDKCSYDDPILQEMFIEDIKIIQWCEGIAFIEGWHKSKGGCVELLLGSLFKKALFELQGTRLRPLYGEAEVCVHKKEQPNSQQSTLVIGPRYKL